MKLIMFILAALSFFLAGANFQFMIDGKPTAFRWEFFGVMFVTLGVWVF